MSFDLPPFIKAAERLLVEIEKAVQTVLPRDALHDAPLIYLCKGSSQMTLDRQVTVCDHCLQASCWLGIFMCYESRGAGTVEKTVGELHDLSLENPEYWFKSPHTGAIDQHGLGAYLQETGKRERNAAKETQHE